MKRRLLSTARLSFPLATAIAALLAAPSAQATPYSWTGLTAGTWNTGTNWSGSTVPLITDDLTILGPLNVAGALTIDFDADNSAKSLTFTNTAATAITNTTSGANKTLTLGSGGVTTGAGAVQLGSTTTNQAVNITLADAQTWNIGAGGMTVTNSIDGTSTGITKTGTGNLILNSGTVNSFTGGLNVTGGTLTLDYTNLTTPTNLVAATNALQINTGVLTITGKNVAAATTSQTFASTSLGAGRNTINIAKGAAATSATLNLGVLTVNPGSVTAFSPTTAWTTTASATERVIITAGGSVPALPGSGSLYLNGLFHRTGAGAGAVRWAAVNSSGQLLAGTALTNLVAGTGSTPTTPVQFQGAASLALTNTAVSTYGLLLNTTSNGLTLTLAASGTYTLNSIIQQQSANGVTIAPGTGSSNLIIGSERNLVINMDNSAGLVINAPIANNGGGVSSVTIASTAPTGTTPGSVSFGGANSYTGATYIVNGALSLTNATALGGNNPGVNGTSGISISAGAVLSSALGGTNPSTTVSAPITLGAGGNTTLRIGQGLPSNTHTFNIDSAIGGATTNLVFTTTTNSFSNGSSVFVLGAAGSYTGNTTITTGNGGNNPVTVRSGVANALPATTVLTMTGGSGGGSGRSLTLDLNGNDQTLAGLTHTLTIPDDRQYRVSSTGAATLTINNSADFSFGGSTKDPDTGANSGTVTSAQITGAISLVKDGAGTFTLGGTLTNGATAAGNAFTGSTKILGGILVLGQTNSIQNSAFDTAGSALGTAGDGLRTTVTTLTLGGLTGGNDFSSRFTSTSGGYADLTAITLNPGTGVSNSYSGDIGNGNGSLRLTKSGLGTQVLTSPNSYTGGTTIAQGTLRINSIADYGAASSIGAPGSGDLVIGSANTGVLDYVGSGASTNRTFTVGSSTATQAGGAFILANGGSALTFTAATFNNVQGTATVARTLTLGGAELGAIDGTIQDNNAAGGGTVAVTKQDAGTWTLGGNSSYTGSTTVSGGTLLINGNSSTATGAVNVNGGTLGGTGRSGAAVTVAATATLSPGASIESLDVASLTMASNSIFAYEVADNTSIGADLLASRTMLSLAGATLGLDPASLAALGGGGWSLGNKLTLISYFGADVTSGFTDYADDTNYTFGSNLWRFNYNDTVAGNNFGADAVAGGQDRFVTITVVPEPNAAALLGALGALALLRRRR